jgi:hypothetical protein
MLWDMRDNIVQNLIIFIKLVVTIRSLQRKVKLKDEHRLRSFVEGRISLKYRNIKLVS